MLYAFIDESERDEKFYFLSAIVCTEDQAYALSMRLHRVMAKHARSHSALSIRNELHASEIMRAPDLPWRKVPLRARIAIYKEALQTIEQSGCRVYIEGIDVEAQKARGYAHITPARELAFGFLLERINECGLGSEARAVHVVADEHHTAEISRSNFNNYQLFGTPGYRSSQLTTIQSPLLFQPSHKSRLLQAADLITYIYNRKTTIQPKDPRAAKAQSDLWSTIEPAAIWPRGRARIWP